MRPLVVVLYTHFVFYFYFNKKICVSEQFLVIKLVMNTLK